jgi:hypothetical protein
MNIRESLAEAVVSFAKYCRADFSLVVRSTVRAQSSSTLQHAAACQQDH